MSCTKRCSAVTGQSLTRHGRRKPGSWRTPIGDTALRHPQAFPIISDRAGTGPGGMRFLAAIHGIFVGAGFDVKQAAQAFDVAGGWVLGAIRQELGLHREMASDAGIAAADIPPDLQPVLEFRDACAVATPDERFAFGLKTLIAGLETTLT